MTRVRSERYRALNKQGIVYGPVLYWMDREMRLRDNWALLRAIEVAREYDQPVGIMYNLVSDYLGGGARQYQFKLGGLREIEELCRAKGIPFLVLLTGDSADDVVRFIKEQKVGYVVTDMSPLRLNQEWKRSVARSIDVSMEEVDAHNIIPVWETSDKQEFAARTIRPKIHKQLTTYLEPFSSVRKQSKQWTGFPKTDWETLERVNVDERVVPVDWLRPGEQAGRQMLQRFIRDRLEGYADGRNDPNADQLSNLSPYFHYGMLAPQRAALDVKDAKVSRVDKDAFIEEVVVRRELSDNYCFYNKNYDNFKGLHAWAQETLNKHRKDKRAYIYTRKQFEEGETHDPLWNAAQMQMVKTGKMHGYMRMYWAKKILEWTKDPETAIRYGIYLNDKYELDGRDPNGYVGVLWSVGGLHDRAWTERPVFGKVRYMNANGCRRKFDVDAYCAKWLNARGGGGADGESR